MPHRDRRDFKEMILRALVIQFPRPLEIAQLTERFESINRSTVKRLVAWLASNGDIVRIGYGTYKATPQGIESMRKEK